jgi:hypothetical protein
MQLEIFTSCQGKRKVSQFEYGGGQADIKLLKQCLDAVIQSTGFGVNDSCDSRRRTQIKPCSVRKAPDIAVPDY